MQVQKSPVHIQALCWATMQYKLIQRVLGIWKKKNLIPLPHESEHIELPAKLLDYFLLACLAHHNLEILVRTLAASIEATWITNALALMSAASSVFRLSSRRFQTRSQWHLKWTGHESMNTSTCQGLGCTCSSQALAWLYDSRAFYMF